MLIRTLQTMSVKRLTLVPNKYTLTQRQHVGQLLEVPFAQEIVFHQFLVKQQALSPQRSVAYFQTP